jgi:hypothetical protein
MSDFTEGDPMIEELARPAGMAHPMGDDHLEDPLTASRGILMAVALSLSVWSCLIWAATKVL